MDVLDLIPADAFKQAIKTKFEAKLSFDDRCAVLAAGRANVQPMVLAVAFGINRRTVTHILNTSSMHYKDVRRKLTELGPDEFRSTYLTETVALRIAEAMSELRTASPEAVSAGPNNVRSNRSAGIHTVNGIKIEIRWNHELQGWYYREGDGDWLHNGDASRITSAACLQGCMENL